MSGQHVLHAKLLVEVLRHVGNHGLGSHEVLHSADLVVVREVSAEQFISHAGLLEIGHILCRRQSNIGLVLLVELFTVAVVQHVHSDVARKISHSVEGVKQNVHEHRVSLDELLDLDLSFLVVPDAFSIEVAGLKVPAAEQDEQVQASPNLDRLRASDDRVVMSKLS